eukprot:Ihof_evm6s19 gene=Ihof_evmTU6s19
MNGKVEKLKSYVDVVREKEVEVRGHVMWQANQESADGTMTPTEIVDLVYDMKKSLDVPGPHDMPPITLLPSLRWHLRMGVILLCMLFFIVIPGAFLIPLTFLAYKYFVYKTILRPAYKFPDLPGPCQVGHLTVRDGVILHYFLVRPATPSEVAEKASGKFSKYTRTLHTNEENAEAFKGKKVIIFANGVGGFLEHLFCLVEQFVPQDYVFLSWDYRGLHGSSSPERSGSLAMRDHCEDARELLDAMGVQCADVFMGWSTGVQIGLEFAALYPERLHKLVLFNGNHSHTLSSAFMPLMRLPIFRDVYHLALNYVIVPFASRVGPKTNRVFEIVYPWVSLFTVQVYAAVYGQPGMEYVIDLYVYALFAKGSTHFTNYLRICQQLDNQSVYASLPEIRTPTLLISAMMDFMTPCWQMYDLE